MSAWKPGDVARTTMGGTVARTAQDRWILLDDGHSINLDHEPRPLVTIDPEDREQVGRLMNIMRPGAMGGLDPLQAALREFANPTPPKPDEPTGLGAVVEDADGERWVHVGPGDSFEVWCPVNANRIATSYAAIDAVKVLSEGVTP